MCRLRLPEIEGRTDAMYFDSLCRLQILGHRDLRQPNQWDKLYNERKPDLKGYGLSVWQLNNNREFCGP